MNNQTVQKTSFAARLIRAALTACLVAGALFASSLSLSAEGTRDIVRTARENYAAVKGQSLPEGKDFQTYDGWDGNIARWCFRAQNDSFVGVNRQQKIKFYANVGETIYIGSSSVADSTDIVIEAPDGTKTNVDLTYEKGGIKTKAQELAGPQGVVLEGGADGEPVGEDGYAPYSFVADQYGTYIVTLYSANENGKSKVGDDGTAGDVMKSTLNKKSFENGPNISGTSKQYIVYAWDVTVTRTEGEKQVAIPGRVWMDSLATEIYSDGGCGMYGYLYAVSRDGYIWRFGFNGMQPYTFAMYANSRGNIGSATNASAYHSVHSPIDNYTDFDFYKNMTDKYGNLDGIYLLGPDNNPTDIDTPCHLFLNEPDKYIPDSVVKTTAQEPGTIESFRYDGSDVESGESTEGSSNNNNIGFVGVDGYFEIETKDASSYRIIIDMSNMYAITYHGENGSSHDTDQAVHDDEICLGAEEEDEGIDPNNFIYHDEDNNWYAIRTIAKDSSDNWNHHPTNKLPIGAASDDDFEGIIEIVKLDDSSITGNWKKDGEDFTTDNSKTYKCLGKILLGNAAVSGRIDRIKWNGRDQYGRSLPVGSYFGDTGRGKIYAQIKAGEIHFPMCDVEYMKNGVSVKLMNAPSDYNSLEDTAKIYYNSEDKSLLHEYSATIPTKKNGRISWVWNLPVGGNSAAGQKVTNANITNWRNPSATFENYSIEGILTLTEVAGVEKTTNDASKFTGGSGDNAGSDHGVVDVWTHVISHDEVNGWKTLDQPIYLYHLSDQMVIQGFVFFDGNTPGGDGNYNLSGNDTALVRVKVTAEWGAVTSESLEKYKTAKDPMCLEFQKDSTGKSYGYYETTTNTDGIYSVPIDTTLFHIQGGVAGYVENTEHYVRITVEYEDPNKPQKAEITTHKVTTAVETSNQRIEKEPNVCVQIVSAKSEHPSLKEIQAENVGFAILPTAKAIRIQKIWNPSQMKSETMTSSFTIKGILESTATPDTLPENDEAFNDDDKVVYMLENVTVDENLGGIVDLTNLPEYGYQIAPDKHLSNEVVDKKGTEKIIYRVIENLTSDKTVEMREPKIKHDADFKLEEVAGATTFDYWNFENTIVISNLSVRVWYDKNNDGVFTEGADSYIKDAQINMGKVNTSTGDLEEFKTYEGYTPEKPDSGTDTTINPDDIKTTDEKGEYTFAAIGAAKYQVTVKFPTDANYNTYYEDGITYNISGGNIEYKMGDQSNIVICTMTIGSGHSGTLDIRVGAFKDKMPLSDYFTVKKQLESNAKSLVPIGGVEFSLNLSKKVEGSSESACEGKATATVDESAIAGTILNPVDFDLKDFVAIVDRIGENKFYLSEAHGDAAGITYDNTEYEITVNAVNNPSDDGFTPHTEYTITKIVQKKDGADSDVTVSAPGKTELQFTNNYSVGRLTVKIGETAGQTADENAEFGIKLTPTSSSNLGGKEFIYAIFDGAVEPADPTDKFTFENSGVTQLPKKLKAGQTLVIYDLPIGALISVSEDLPTGYVIDAEEITLDGAKASENPRVNISENEDPSNNHTVTFKNIHKEGSLSITKTVVSPADPLNSDPDFKFTITVDEASAAGILSAPRILNSVEKNYVLNRPTLPISAKSPLAPTALTGFTHSLELVVEKDGESVSGAPKTLEFVDGVATVTLKNGYTATVSGLPDGLKYTVEESSASMPNGYILTESKNAEGNIEYNETLAASFTNTFKTGDLSVTKTLASGGNDVGFSFTVILTAPDGIILNSAYDYTVNGAEKGSLSLADNVLSFELKNGETAVIKDLPAGTEFTVSEKEKTGYATTHVEVDGKPASDMTAKGKISYNEDSKAKVTSSVHFWNSPEVVAEIKGTKSINGRSWMSKDNGAYSFTIAAADGNEYLPEAGTVENSEENVSFKITYDKIGTYTYNVTETEPTDGLPGGVTIDGSTWEVTVKISESADHLLEVSEISYSKAGESKDGFEFVNQYTANPVSLDSDQLSKLVIYKNLTGSISDSTPKTFGFTVSRSSAPAGAEAYSGGDFTVTVADGDSDGSYTGSVNSSLESSYTKVGDYVYEIREKDESKKGVTYDKSVYKVTVSVTDDTNGQLVIDSVSTALVDDGSDKPVDKIEFNNEYAVEPVTAIAFNISKILTLDETKFGSDKYIIFPEDFTFSAVIEKNGAKVSDGTAGWGDIGSLSPTYTFTSDGGKGPDDIGRGTVLISGLKFTEEGTYTLKITENKPADGHVKMATNTVSVTYTVKDIDGTLSAVSGSTEGLEFKNIYEPDPVSVGLSVGKKLENTVTGSDLLAGELTGNEPYREAFKFKLEDVSDSAGVATIKNAEVQNNWGTVDFGESDAITFDRTGTYKFKITEEEADIAQVTTDSKEIYAAYTVGISDSGELLPSGPDFTIKESASVSAETPVEPGETPAFINHYGPVPCILSVTNLVNTNPAGIAVDQSQTFEFTVTLSDGGALSGTIDNAIKEEKIFYIVEKAGAIALMSFKDGKEYIEKPTFTVTLHAGERAVIQGIPYLTDYSVSETSIREGYKIQSVTHDKDNVELTSLPVTGRYPDTEKDSTEVVFTNLYTLTSATEALPALTKTYDGPEPLNDGLFSFTAEISGDVADGAEFASGGTAKTVANVGGSISFGDITFTKPGTYTVTVNEVIPSPERVGVTYDRDPVTLTYTVTDNKNGTLSVSEPPVYGAKTGFTNEYSPDPANTVITVTENLNGALNASETFTVNAVLDSSTSSSGAAEASKTVSFTLGKEVYTASEDLSFEFTEAGTYVYKVTQAVGNSQGMSYSGESYTVTFTVTDEGFDGQLDCAVSVTKDSDGAVLPTAELSFTNTYTTYQYAIENLVVGASVGDSHEFPFTVSFEAEAGKTLIGEYAYAITDIGADVSASCSHTFEETGIPLKGAQDLVISGIPAGAVLKISVPARSVSYDLTMPETSESYYSSSTTLENNEGNAKFVWTKNPDRYIFKEETYPRDGSSVLVGEEMEYRIHWVNPLPEDNVLIVITDVLDEGLELIDGGDEYNDLTRAVTWTFTANSGEEGYVTLRAKVTAKAAIKGQISNSATMTYNGIEVEAPSNEVINPLNSITVTKTQSVNGIAGASAAVREGDVITYTLTVSAEGVEGGSAENVIIADYLPAGLILDQSSLAGGEYDPATGAIVWKIGEISDGSEKSVSYTASVPYVSAYTLWSETAYARAGDPEGHELSLPKVSADGWIHSEPVSAYPVGDLSVTKTVQPAPGSDMPVSRTEFLFEVRLSDSLGAPLDGAYEFDLSSGASGAAINGYAELRLAGGDTATFKDLPAGTRYSVKEISDASGYTPENGGISEGSVGNSKAPVTAEIINTYSFTELSFGTVSVTNIVSGAPESTVFHYRIILGDTSINGVYGGIQFVGGTASFELSSGQSVTFADLPSDISYDVIELEANSLGFETHSSNQSGIVPENESVTAIFYNEKVSGGLLITNTVVGYQSDSARFGYTLYLTDETGAPLTDEFAYFGTQSGTIIGGTALLSLGDGDRIEISGLPKGAAYTLSPLGDSTGFSTEIIGASGVVAANEVSAIEIVSSRKTGGLTVTSRVVGGSGAETYSFVVQLSDPAFSGVCGGLIFTNGVAEVTLTGNQSVTAAGIPSGLSYTVIETNANVGCTTVSVGESGVIPEGSGASAVFTNTVLTPGSLIVSKTVVGHDFSALPFRFSIEISDGFSGQIFDGFGAPVGVISEGVGEFTLSDGQHVLIPSLPVGAAYTVTEIDARGMIPDAAAKTGVITEAGAAEALVNTVPSGGITVRNTVSGTASDRSRPFSFRLELIGLPLEGIYGDLNFTSGISDFTLSHGQSVNISGIPAGTMFTVTELDAGADGYSTVPAEGFISGVVTEGTSYEAAFVNHKDAPLEVHSGGSLAIINNVVGTETSELFDFTIKLTDAFGNPVSGLYPAVLPQGEIMTLADQTVEFDALGEAHISLRHGERAIISAIPAGCVYSVFETENIYFKVTSINETGTISESVRSTAVFSNKWHVGSLRLTNLVEFETGGNVSYDAQEFEYTITLDQPIDHSLRFNSAAPESGKLMEFVGGVATVTLKNNETAIAVDLPAGVGYTVSVRPVNWYYQRSAVGSSGHIIDGTTSEAEFVYYIKTGSLSISKVVYDYRWLEYEDHTLFPFTVKFTDVNGNPLVGEFGYVGEGGGTVSNGGVINVSGGGKITILGLPEGVTYEITENLTGTRYRILPEYTSGTSGVIQADTESTALVTNLNRSTGPDLPIAPPGPPSQPSTPAEPSVPSIPSLPTVPSETLPSGDSSSDVETIPDDGVEIERPIEGAEVSEDPANPETGLLPTSAAAVLCAAAAALSRRRK